MHNNLYMKKMGEKAKIASLSLSNIKIHRRNSVLKEYVQYLKKNSHLILNANKKDVLRSQSKDITNSMTERLKLDNKKIQQIIYSIKEIIKFRDPLGKTLSSWKRPNGLFIKIVSIQVGVITIN